MALIIPGYNCEDQKHKVIVFKNRHSMEFYDFMDQSIKPVYPNAQPAYFKFIGNPAKNPHVDSIVTPF